MKKERTESKSSEDSESDSKKHETKAVDSIKNVAHPNAEKIVIAEPTKSEVLSLAKPQEKVIKFEEKKENLPLNNAINPKFAQETFIKPAFISSNPASETEVKKISKETPTATSPKRFFADAVNPLAAKRSIPSETYSATHLAPTSLVHTL